VIRQFGGGGLKIIPILAHKSTPIKTGAFNEGIVKNLCDNFFVSILTDNVIALGILVGEFARWIVLGLS